MLYKSECVVEVGVVRIFTALLEIDAYFSSESLRVIAVRAAVAYVYLRRVRLLLYARPLRL